MAISNFDEARAAVVAGGDPRLVARELVEAMTPEERLWCLDGDAPTWAGLAFLADDGYHRAPFLAGRVERVAFPGVAFADGPRGSVIGNGTCFPVAMARGATWDPDLEERVGDAIGRELRAAGATLTGAVCVNLLRHPAWGRAQETYGEDPHHVGELGAAFTRGLQRHLMACVKHFACNSIENARFSIDVEVDDVALHEVYLPHFRRIVDEGVASVMSAYNSVNGQWCGQNPSLLNEVLRDEWSFGGFVISDWIFGLRDAAASLAAGLDIEMPYRMVRARDLPSALDRGDASWADVDTAVERIVATVLRFDHVLSQPAPPPEVIGCAGHRRLAREVAARSAVLLRNEVVGGTPVLPLDRDTRVAVIGRLADTVNLGDGGSSDVWDLDCSTVLQGMRAAIDHVEHDDGSDPRQAARVAAGAHAAVVVVGYTHLDEGEFIGTTDPSLGHLFPDADEPDVVERYRAFLDALPPMTKPARLASRPSGFSQGGDRTSLRLHSDDVELIRAVAGVNPRTIVAIQAGSAVIMTEWIDPVAAVIQSWYAGGQAGPALADVLLGLVSPSGRLPFTVPRDEADLPPFDRHATLTRYDPWHGWWHLVRRHRTAAFPFGFGLSYTTFSLEDVEVTAEASMLAIRGTIHNTGQRDGSDVIQVYAELPSADAPDRLVGFGRTDVPARQSRTFEVRAPVERLARRDPVDRHWNPPSGRHTIIVGRHAGDPHAHRITVDLEQ